MRVESSQSEFIRLLNKLQIICKNRKILELIECLINIYRALANSGLNLCVAEISKRS